ncbi:TIGR03618 family F420-dependent PPOX class oxidoreductase [Microbacterium betulae]|uniref:TIGR03618 family F420-dependent PPOX class oxidoreductase n=1 Tax=Microbacterium betulae TaxID=2981139 RepID=A0AA97FF17_9MICO|nr:TIGR03618 family F420-dependent PPOX class oxidoreductase [Microbacterium sp. AB]WOF21703.1 TIGR03618 family F420-dependent PPOX class oxidoreductase [Microbacterium sp. AB]
MITDAGLALLTERHLATLSTFGRDGRIHAVPVGITYRDGIVRVIGSRGTQKFVNARRSGRASVSTVDGRRWISLEGPAVVREEPEAVALAVELYTERYGAPRANPRRVALEIAVEHVLASAGLRA